MLESTASNSVSVSSKRFSHQGYRQCEINCGMFLALKQENSLSDAVQKTNNIKALVNINEPPLVEMIFMCCKNAKWTFMQLKKFLFDFLFD